MPVSTSRWNRTRYTLWAPFYDRVVRFDRQRRRAIELLDLRSGEKLLMIGAGTGQDLAYLPEAVRVTAVDITPAMIARIEQKALGLGRSIDARVMDAERLDFAEGSFDAVILHLILAVVPDPFACMREAVRVLRPEGRASIFDKFLPDDRKASAARFLINLVTNFLVTDINRKLTPLLAASPVVLEHREDAAFGGFFQIAIVRKRE